ncbi:MAG: hypothetical protein DHS80DRAFT_18006 [Piptocephalis tieghemiana]|nr:MAG: hypothetical protein DHS80DRAFT_18006 [Piptocephalis tieghemiana]
MYSSRRNSKGSSDAHQLPACQCGPGHVLLYYLYTPLPPPQSSLDSLDACAQDHTRLLQDLGMHGKVRISPEGINATVAGDLEACRAYMARVTTSPIWLAAQPSSSSSSQDPTSFFKPTPGCKHAFPDISVRVVQEACPIGLPFLQPRKTQTVKLSPAAFHARVQAMLHDQTHGGHKSTTPLLLDVRNAYESRLGHFEGAILPPLRRFGSFPQWARANREALRGRDILTYCTGGIRCEKAGSFLQDLQESWALEDRDPTDDTKPLPPQVWELQGGIHAYFAWLEQEMGRSDDPNLPPQSSPPTSLYKGYNYVFDARQILPPPSFLESPGKPPKDIPCLQCSSSACRVGKCVGKGCHLVFPLCSSCSLPDQQVWCCDGCRLLDLTPPSSSSSPLTKPSRPLCSCELERQRSFHTPLSLPLPQ